MGFSWGWLCARVEGPSGFGGPSTAEEVTAGVDSSHLTVVFTGATNVIGKETARVLALRGAEVILPARSLESGMKVKENLAEQIPSSKLHVMEMDLSSVDSVRSFAKSFNSSYRHLNVLMGNVLPFWAIQRWD